MPLEKEPEEEDEDEKEEAAGDAKPGASKGHSAPGRGSSEGQRLRGNGR